jgi:hypothetical protein
MKRAAAVFFLCCASAAQADDAADMKTAATAFYSVSTSLRSDGIPDAAELKRLEPVTSVPLQEALTAAGTAQARFMSRNKHAPPLLEGNVFSSLFEGATRFSVTDCQSSGVRGQCSVTLGHDDKSGKAPITWTDTLLLVKERGGWRADDVRYGGQWPFANTGTLRDTLKLAAGLSR